MRLHRLDSRRDGHPKVCGQAQTTVGKQVDVLRHVGIARLERKVGSQHDAGANAWLHALVSLAFNGEGRVVHAGVHSEDVAEGHVVLGVKCRFVGNDFRGCHHRVIASHAPERHFYRLHIGTEAVVGVVATETDFMVGQGGVVEIYFGGQVIDVRLVGHVELGLGIDVSDSTSFHSFEDVQTQVVAVLCVVDRGIHKQLLRHDVVPTQGGHLVAPFPVEVHFVGVLDVINGIVLVFHAEIYGIIPRVEAEVKTVFVRNFPVEFGVEVVEIVAHAQFVELGVGYRSNPKGGLEE